MGRITYKVVDVLAGKKLDKETLIMTGDNLTIELAIDFTGTPYEAWEKRCDLKVSDGGEDIFGTGSSVEDPIVTDTIAIWTLKDKHTKTGALVINPYAQLNGARKGFPKKSVTIESQLNNDNVTATVRVIIEDYIDQKLTVKEVITETLDPSFEAAAGVNAESDGLTFIFGIPQGIQGLPGLDGADGYTPIKGVDYDDGYTPIKGVDYFDGVTQDISGKADKTELTTLETKIRKYIIPTLTHPADLLSVPIISDTFNNLTGVITRNVKKITISGTDFNGISAGTQRDIIFTIVIPDAKIGTSFVDGQTILVDKDGVTMTEASTADITDNIGTYALTSLARIWISVPKGTYANITDARTALGTMELTFQLATPTTSSYGTEYIIDFENVHNFKLTTATETTIAFSFANVPTETLAIISSSILIDYAVASTFTYPASVVWQNGLAPTFTVGNKYILIFASYDNGTTWFGSVAGEW